MLKALIAEFCGTFLIVYGGTTVILSPGFDNLDIGAAFGLLVTIAILLFRYISGAHFNPAVTIALASAGEFPWRGVIPYILAQCSGAIGGSYLVRSLFGLVGTLGGTYPLHDQWLLGLLIETGISFFLMSAILCGWGAFRLGLLVAALAVLHGPLTGAGMNPARSLGPAIMSGQWQHHWVYWIGPIVGMQLAVFAAKSSRS